MRETEQTNEPAKPGKPAPTKARDARLKAALKANIARRKAQAGSRAKAGSAHADTDNKKNE